MKTASKSPRLGIMDVTVVISDLVLSEISTIANVGTTAIKAAIPPRQRERKGKQEGRFLFWYISMPE
ncbi:hypothetical protein GCM10022398_02580 [Acetobacter lovaniensis]